MYSASKSWGNILILLFAVFAVAPAALGAIEEDWTVYPDPDSEAECGVVTAANVDLIVLFEDGVMVIVSGTDVILEDLVVDEAGNVRYLNEPAGIVAFAEDKDGLPTLFWLSLGGTVVEIDTFTGEPSDSGLLPEDIGNTVCDACELIDQSSLCDDGGNGNGNDNGNGGTIEIPVFCGAGAPGALAMSLLGLPLLGWRRAAGRPSAR
jgi:hypothetical protein